MRCCAAAVVVLVACNARLGGHPLGAESDAPMSVDAPTCRPLGSSWTPQWDSLIAYEPFDGSGAIANDASISAVVGQDGVATNTQPGMAYVTGKVGQAIQFDGVDDYLTVSLPNIDQAAGGTVTIALWVNWDGNLYTNMCCDWTMFLVFPNAAYDVTFMALPGSSTSALGFNTHNKDLWGTAAADLGNTWVHMVAVFVNGESNVNQLYLNGQSVTTTQELGAAHTSQVGTPLVVAAEPGYPSFFGGSLDELAVWNAELSASDVATLYAGQAGCP